MTNRRLWVACGAAGVVGTVCYLLAIVLPWPETQLGRSAGLLTVGAWPILSIVFAYGLYTFVAAEHESTSNRLGFVFAVAAFAMVLAMIVVQLAVGAGLGEMTRGLEESTARALRRAMRLVDLGLDVAWDLLIGTSLAFSGVAMRGRTGLGPGWSIPAIVLGLALIGLNAATFPWPPDSRGLFDIGPFIGVFIMALATRLAWLGRRAAS